MVQMMKTVTKVEASTSPAVKLKLNLIRVDGGTQSRAAMNPLVIEEYAELIKSRVVVLPPIVVFYDGQDYWLADGFHRLAATRQLGYSHIEAQVKQGTRRDAILYSVGANAQHGLRRTNADKRRAIEMLLEDEEWSKWSDMKVAAQCGVTDKTVSRYRRGFDWSDPSSSLSFNKSPFLSSATTANIAGSTNQKSILYSNEPSAASQQRLVQRGNQVYPMNVAGIGGVKEKKKEAAPAHDMPIAIIRLTAESKEELEQAVKELKELLGDRLQGLLSPRPPEDARSNYWFTGGLFLKKSVGEEGGQQQ